MVQLHLFRNARCKYSSNRVWSQSVQQFLSVFKESDATTSIEIPGVKSPPIQCTVTNADLLVRILHIQIKHVLNSPFLFLRALSNLKSIRSPCLDDLE